MSRAHLTETDLRLFLVLDALLAEGSVTRAAARLRQTQSAVSHSLRQLRERYNDALLVRGRGGMMPTPLALELVPFLRLGLTELERVLNRDLSFDPAHSTRLFSLATPDYPHVTGLPVLVARLRREAPGVDVRVRPIRSGMVEDLASGRLDTVLAGGEVEQSLALESGLMRTRIISEPLVCILRRGHPALDGGLDLETYLELPHVLISTSGGDKGIVDDSLAKLGRSRRVAATVPSFTGAPHLVACSDMIATVPRGLAAYGARALPIAVVPAPIELPMGDAYLWWHPRFQDDPGHAWWRKALLDAFLAHR